MHLLILGLWRPVLGAPSVVNLPIRFVPGCVFISMPAVTTCVRYAGWYIFYLCQQWWPVPGKQSGIFLPMPACARLWQPVPGMRIVIFLLMPAVLGCDDLWQICTVLYFHLCQLCQVRQVLYFYLCQPVPGCDDLCQVCELLYFYLWQLWRSVPGMWIVIFLTMPAVTTCAVYTEDYIFTYASCAGCLKCSFFYRCQLWRPVPGMWIVIFLSMPGRTTCAGYAECCISTYASQCQAVTTCTGYVDCYMSTYASCDDLRRVYRGLYFYQCQLCRVLEV